MEILKLITNPNNIAGLWYVIAAFVALFGIIINNFFENKRRRSDKRHELIRTAYIESIDYIDFALKFFLKQNLHENSITEQEQTITRKYYKLFLSGSAHVLEAFSNFSKKFTELSVKLVKHDIEIKSLLTDINIQTQKRDNSLQLMNDINDKKKTYNDKKIHDEKLWNFYIQQFEEANLDFKNSASELDKLNYKKVEIELNRLKCAYNAMLYLSPLAYETIVKMREDIDRKLSHQDNEIIEKSIRLYLSQLEKTCNEFLEFIQKEIDKIENSAD